MQTPDLPDLKPPAIIDTAERTALPGAAKTFNGCATTPYQTALIEQGHKRNARFYLHGDSNHFQLEIWEFYLSMENMCALHALGVRTMGLELPKYAQSLVDDYTNGKITRLIFEKILLAELAAGNALGLSPEENERAARIITQGADDAKKIGIHIAFADPNQEIIVDPWFYQSYIRRVYDSLADQIKKMPEGIYLPPEAMLELYHATEIYVQNMLIPEQKLALENAINFKNIELVRRISAEDAAERKKIVFTARANAMRIHGISFAANIEPFKTAAAKAAELPSPTIPVTEEEKIGFDQARKKNDTLVANDLKDHEKRGAVALLFGRRHLSRENVKKPTKEPMDIDGTIINHGGRVMTVMLMSPDQLAQTATEAERATYLRTEMEKSDSFHGALFVGPGASLILNENPPQPKPSPKNMTANNKPKPEL